MLIDCDNYLVLARSGHPSESRLHGRDETVGLLAAKRIAKQMRDRYQSARVEIFLCDGRSRILVTG